MIVYGVVALVVAFGSGFVMGRDPHLMVRNTGSTHIAALAIMAILWPVTVTCLLGTLIGHVLFNEPPKPMTLREAVDLMDPEKAKPDGD